MRETKKYTDPYAQFSDKTRRNQDTLDDADEALAELQADKAVEQFVARYKDEPKFRSRIYRKLAPHLLGNIDYNKEDEI